MHIAVDLDGTIDASPTLFVTFLTALKTSGQTVTILTGAAGDANVSKQDIEEKKQYLARLGLGEAYDQLVVLPQVPIDDPDKDTTLHDAKADWLAKNHVDLFIDNNKMNAKAAMKAGVKLVLVPWATRE